MKISGYCITQFISQFRKNFWNS